MTDDDAALQRPRRIAEYLGVPETLLNQWRYQRVGPPFIKVGRAVRYRRRDVDAWLECKWLECKP
jgi:excisionase family DNA binding protein